MAGKATAEKKAELLADAFRRQDDGWLGGYFDDTDPKDALIDGHYDLISVITEYERLLAELETTL